MAKKQQKTIASGFRKTSVARALFEKGSGELKINNQTLSEYNSNTLAQLRIQEPLVLSGKGNDFNISVNVFGGGQNSQVDAIRQSLARGLVEITGSDDLKKTFVDYDRTLLVADPRFRETNKPNNSNPRAKRQKSYR